MFNWEKLFQNKNIHDQLKLFNETIVNIVSNCIPDKFITCNDKDSPWLNDHMKRPINLKHLRSTSRTKDLILFMKTCKPLLGI